VEGRPAVKVLQRRRVVSLRGEKERRAASGVIDRKGNRDTLCFGASRTKRSG